AKVCPGGNRRGGWILMRPPLVRQGSSFSVRKSHAGTGIKIGAAPLWQRPRQRRVKQLFASAPFRTRAWFYVGEGRADARAVPASIDGEARAAAAGRLRVGIDDREVAAHQVLFEVELGIAEELERGLVDD